MILKQRTDAASRFWTIHFGIHADKAATDGLMAAILNNPGTF